MEWSATMNKSKLFVALLSPGWPLKFYPNGIVTYVKNIVLGFSSQIDVAILTSNLVNGNDGAKVVGFSGYVKKNGLLNKLCDIALWLSVTPKFIRNGCNGYKVKSFCTSIASAVKGLEKKVDVIEVEESFGRAKYLVDVLDIPVITRLHGPWFIHGPIMKLDKAQDYQQRVKLEGEAIKASHGVTAPSLDVLNRVREYYRLPLENAVVIPNPVPPVLKINQWQCLTDIKPTVLVVGRFDLHKGGDLAIDAFRIIAKKNEQVELLFVGSDRGVVKEGVDYTFVSYVNNFVPETSVRERIKFLGHCDADEITKLRQRSTVTLMPSRYDNFPMSLLEAVATGSPVVAARAGGMKEIIVDGVNGLLADAESPESMAEKVMELLSNPEKMQLLSKNAIKDAQERFSPAAVASQTEAYYRRILNV